MDAQVDDIIHLVGLEENRALCSKTICTNLHCQRLTRLQQISEIILIVTSEQKWRHFILWQCYTADIFRKLFRYL